MSAPLVLLEGVRVRRVKDAAPYEQGGVNLAGIARGSLCEGAVAAGD